MWVDHLRSGLGGDAAGDWRRAGEVASELRAAGATVALTDIEIAVGAAGANARLWSWDADFARVETALRELERFSP